MSDPEVKDGQYRCAMCKGIFDFNKDWRDEDAQIEAMLRGIDLNNSVIVCDDCYKLTPWGNN